MASPIHFFLLAAFSFSLCNAGPLPNVTSVDIGLKEGSCALGDVVYMPGDAFPGTSACEKCTCSDGVVQCTKQRCEPRPGCKAVHRPDHCCPTYQCECEQEGRIYGNGEKLVDPLDPCRVCYCQGGEVVCRRIACFVRDDCQPRLVPGRCCPEYDNCPVRDGTPLPGVTSSLPSMPIMKEVEPSSAPPPPSEPAKPEITIKEITPVSEIPVRTDVKIKEILPSPSIEVAEYASSKSPPIPREATSENPSNDAKSQIDSSEPKKGLSSMSPDVSTSSEQSSEIKDDEPPSKISLSTQDSVNDIIASKIPSIVPMMGPSMPDLGHLTTKTAIIEEEDLDHNPAFPPIPDDLFLVLSNHDEESDQSMDSEHVPMDHDVKHNVPISTQQPIFKESPATTIGYISDIVTITKDILDVSVESSTHSDIPMSTPSPFAKENTMLNMRSVIPTDILNSPSLISDDSTGDILDVTEGPVTGITIDKESSTETKPIDLVTKITPEIKINPEEIDSNSSLNETVANEEPKTTEVTDSGNKFDETTNGLSKSTEIISETEFSSIPIETSDQNPHDISEPEKENNATESTPSPITDLSIELSSDEDEVITLSRALPSENEQSFDNSETTEFIMSSFGSQESATDTVELIKVVDDSDKSSSLIEPPQRNNNVLTDLINLVGDVASISDHTDGPEVERQTSSPTTISDSEELIPVNVAAGYKSKNKNWNLNSITEIPLKNKIQNKQKIIEIEGDDTDTITDSPPPHDKIEPTTRLPIIDNVSDTNNKTEISGKKDIEIITHSYVPTINRRPTKIMKKEKPAEEEVTTDVTTDVSDVTNVVNSETTTGAEETEKSSQ